MTPSHPTRRYAFTLVELLVVVGVIAVLLAILLPAISAAQRSARRVTCLSQQRQMGIAIASYANDNSGQIPYGPDALPGNATNFYPVTGTVTSLISLQNGAPVALGLALNPYLARIPRILFCPDADQSVDASAELAKVGTAQAQCDYFYRHGSNYSFLIPPTSAYINLADLGTNRNGFPIRALVMDQNFLVGPGGAAFGVLQRTNHSRVYVNVLFSDGHAQTFKNSQGQLTVDGNVNPFGAWDSILTAFETADRL